MKREMTAALGAVELPLAATFKASVEVSEKVADPLLISREAMIEGMMISGGMAYQPKFAFTVSNVPVLLHIGHKAAGGKMTLEQVQEAVFEAGFISAMDQAAQYIRLLVEPHSDEIEPKDTDAAPGE